MPTRRLTAQERRRCAKACEACRRRKERCNGHNPCGRCIVRRVGAQCTFTDQITGRTRLPLQRAPATEGFPISPTVSNDTVISPATPPRSPTFIHQHKGDYIFLGDSATGSFLQDVRMLVNVSIGDCEFSCDPLPGIVLGHPQDTTPLMQLPTSVVPPSDKFSLGEAESLIRNGLRASSFMVDILDEDELILGLPQWLENTGVTGQPYDEVYHIVIALGLQATDSDKDDLAQQYFRCGCERIFKGMEDPTVTMVQCSLLSVWYLLCAARRSAAYMFLSLTIQAAHALGLQRQDVGVLFPPHQTRMRERLWRSIHTIDGHMATSLGRPTLTTQTRDVNASEAYSSHEGLAHIFALIKVEIYEKRRISVDILDRITRLQRTWTDRLNEGLANDQVSMSTELDTLEGPCVNMAIIHVRAAYYWTIILVTRHTLMEKAQQVSRSSTGGSTWLSNMPVLVDACVDSAIKIIDLFKIFLRNKNHPKRMPFVLTTTFTCAMVLGSAYFADLDGKFPLETCLEDVHALLIHLGKSDAYAAAICKIVGQLQEALRSYVEVRAAKGRNTSLDKVAEMFGDFGSGARMADDATRTTSLQPVADRPKDARPRQTPAATPQDLPECQAPEYREQIMGDEGFPAINDALLYPSIQSDFPVAGDAGSTWLDSSQTYHFGTYDEISAFFTVTDHNYFT